MPRVYRRLDLEHCLLNVHTQNTILRGSTGSITLLIRSNLLHYQIFNFFGSFRLVLSAPEGFLLNKIHVKSCLSFRSFRCVWVEVTGLLWDETLHRLTFNTVADVWGSLGMLCSTFSHFNQLSYVILYF